MKTQIYNNNHKRNYLLKVFYGQKVERYETHSIRRFYNHARTIKWKNKPIKVYLRISYGKQLTLGGKLENFWNDGKYTNKEDFELALNAFLRE